MHECLVHHADNQADFPEQSDPPSRANEQKAGARGIRQNLLQRKLWNVFSSAKSSDPPTTCVEIRRLMAQGRSRYVS